MVLIWVPSTGSSSSSSSSGSGPGTNLVRIQHTYDRMSNRLSRRDLVAESFSAGLDELYQYDLINRMNDLNRGTLNSTASAINPGSGTFNQCWSLDTTGNWSGLRQDDTGDGIWDLVQSRTANPVNEITGITNAVGSAWVQPVYDAAGNMTTVPQPADPTKAFTCTYDAWNRLVKVVDASTGNTVAQYAYDGAKRRTIKLTYTAGVLSETRHFFYTDPSRWQVVEERVGTSTNAERQFVWGLRYIDDLLLRDRDTTGSATLNERLYGLQDPNWNMVAVANFSGVVQERYSYDAYGAVTYLTGSFAPHAASSFAWETLYCGCRSDSESHLYTVRNRVLNPHFGWVQRDPTGLSTDNMNLYRYALNNPLALVDPDGLDSIGAAGGAITGVGIGTVAGAAGGAVVVVSVAILTLTPIGWAGWVVIGVSAGAGAIVGGVTGGIAGSERNALGAGASAAAREESVYTAPFVAGMICAARLYKVAGPMNPNGTIPGGQAFVDWPSWIF